MEKSLFIFDGLDELQIKLCKEIEDIIFGRGAKHAHVVVTSRPCKILDQLESGNLQIELKGYTDEGVDQQLQKFSIDTKNIGNDLRSVLKVPLFNTLFCITHHDTTVGCVNICTAIEKFVRFACNRYRKSNSDFTEIKENELLLLLGQAAQFKYKFIKFAEQNDIISKFKNKIPFLKPNYLDYPIVSTEVLSSAIEKGLIYQRSIATDLIFAHQTIAEYCAGYFWFKKTALKVRNVLKRDVEFAKPNGGRLNINKCFQVF